MEHLRDALAASGDLQQTRGPSRTRCRWRRTHRICYDHTRASWPPAGGGDTGRADATRGQNCPEP